MVEKSCANCEVVLTGLHCVFRANLVGPKMEWSCPFWKHETKMIEIKPLPGTVGTYDIAAKRKKHETE